MMLFHEVTALLMMVEIVQPVPVEGVLAARTRLAGLAVATPCVRLNSPERNDEIYLKLENLQPIGSFKLRPIGNSILSKPSVTLAQGVHTASSGNSAIAVSWMAKRLGVPATVIVTDNVPAGKAEHLQRLGAQIVRRPFERWWREVTEGVFSGIPGVYIDAAREPAALCGNGTIGFEILESVPDVEAIFTPFGSGALACGIACAVRAVKPDVKIIACELESAHPMTAARKAGGPVMIEHDTGFVSGVGFGSVLQQMWPLVNRLIDDTLTVSLAQVASAIRLMTERSRCIAEGAGAIPVAAALFAQHPYRKVCAVVSGGNIDRETLVRVLGGDVPSR